MRQSTLLILLVWCMVIGSEKAAAQAGWFRKQNGNWAFVEYSGIDFINGTVPMGIRTQLVQPGGLNSQSSAAVSDANGQLLFYTNTDSIWDKNGNCMPNGAIGGPVVNGQTSPEGSLGGNMFQGVVILPVIDNPQQYYVFVLNGLIDICNLWTPLSHQLKYSIVDMTLNSGLGDVVPTLKNINVDSALGGMMTAVRGNNCNIWLLVHMRDSMVFKSYEITEAGLNPVPVISKTGNFDGDYANKWGMMQVSSDRKRLAFANAVNYSAPMKPSEMGGVELCDFNATSGIVSNAQILTDSKFVFEDQGGGASVCFSPDDSRLYASIGKKLFQYDLTLPNISAMQGSSTLVTELASSSPGILLGYDGRIYTMTTGKDAVNATTVIPYLGVIQNPNGLGAACNFVRKGIELAQLPKAMWKGPYWGIGNCNAFEMPTPFDPIYTLTDTVICSNQDSLFFTSGFKDAWTFEWNDSSTNLGRAITEPGTYWVRSQTFCHFQVDTFVVKRVDVDFNLGVDTSVCDLSFLLSIAVPGVDYLWQDGIKESSYQVKKSGTYSATITSKEGCINVDSINIVMINVRQNLGPDISICAGDPINLFFHANVPAGAVAEWNDYTTLVSLKAIDTGRYWVTVTQRPCQESDSVQISREWCDCRLMIPNAFSPNGDGLNDCFLPLVENPACLDLGNYTLDIYNRFGQLVYQGVLGQMGWDGQIKGAPADAGTYMYYVKYNIGTKPKFHVQQGDVVLLR